MLVGRALSTIVVLVTAATIAMPVRAEQPNAPTPDDDPPTAAPTTRASAAARPLDNDMQRAKLVRNWGIVTLASGVALVGVGAGFEVWRLGHAPCKDVKISDRVETCNRDMAAHATLITIASGIAILGAVLVGLGQSRLSRARRGQRVTLAPAVGRGSASASFSLRF